MASIGSKERATNVDRHVGAKIRARRTEMGMNQHDLAKALKLSYQQVQKYETGSNRISAGRLYEAAQILHVDVADLFVGLDPTVRGPDLEHGGKNRAMISVANDFDKIGDPDTRAAVATIVRAACARKRRR